MLYRVKSWVKGLRALPSRKSALRIAVKNPHRAWDYLRRTGSTSWIQHFFTGLDEHEALRAELMASGLLEELSTRLKDRFRGITGKTIRGNPYVSGEMKIEHALALYTLVRKLRPQVLVETGVCNGFSTAMLLKALAENNSGRLYSIDLPEITGEAVPVQKLWAGKGGAVIPRDERVGWLVPAGLSGRWELQIGKSQELLSPLLDRLGSIDFFLHDSEHSFDNQLFEFQSAYRHLNNGGILAASDLTFSPAFDRFSLKARCQARTFYVDHSLAIVER